MIRINKNILSLAAYLSLLLVVLINLPKTILMYYDSRTALLSFGLLGIWRYSWWLSHVIRSLIYRHIVFPQYRRKAQHIWNSGWRPKCIYFMMTTFNELQTTTETVLQSILSECNQLKIETKLFVGIGSDFDKTVIDKFFSTVATDYPFHLIFVRQKNPGKRFAIGETVRAIIQDGLSQDDPVIFMDGDTYFVSGCLEKCLPLFPLHKNMQALTTYEEAIINKGPYWMKKWLAMRFAQRDFTMHSYSLSKKILTLTGRMSIFRGKHLLDAEFIEIIENDQLNHWLWGNFRFLSGDDKSTWYYLLKQGAEMLYVPDATTITIENITGNSLDRAIENLRRWTGNTLRNGARAIALGPRCVGVFIWWCIIDQRLAIWTMLAGHMILLTLAFTKDIAFILVGILWIAFSRLCASLVLFYYHRQIDITFPPLLYFNQLLSALIKVYILFRLPQQKWKNRGNQLAGFETSTKIKLKNWVASYLTTFYCVLMTLLVLLYLKILSFPSLSDFKIFYYSK